MLHIEALSELVKQLNGPGQLANLKRAGYMSPQDHTFTGQGFACNQCDWFERNAKMTNQTGILVGFCKHPAIRAYVETNGCSNLFTYKGVHTS